MGLLDVINQMKTEDTEEKIKDKKQEAVLREEKIRQAEEEAPEEDTSDPYEDLKGRLQKQAVKTLNENYSEEQKISREEFVNNTVRSLLDSSGESVPRAARDEIIQSVTSEIIGLGPLDKLLADDDVSEIMVNGPRKIFVERHGKLSLTNVKFRDDAHVMTIIDRIVTPLGRHIDEASPLVDARLADGSRVNVIIPPLALDGPTITIRKFPKSAITAQNLIHWGSASPRMLEFLEACVLGRCNTIVSGGTGSGKSHSVNTPIYTLNDGILSVKKIGEVKPGDIVIQRNGKSTKVTGIYPQGKKDVWEVYLKDGRLAECSADHQWTVAKESHGAIVECVMTTQEMFEKGVIRIKNNKTGVRHQAKYWIPRVEAIESNKQYLPIDPWLLGYLIGNGSLSSSPGITFATTEQYVLERVKKLLGDKEIHKIPKTYNYYIKNANDIREHLYKFGLLKRSEHKFIPQIYKQGSKDQRLELLHGLMDSDGYCSSKGTASYSTVSKQLAEDVKELAISLGYSVTISLDIREDKYQYSDHTAYQVIITGGHLNPFSLPRKAEKFDTNYKRKHEKHVSQTYVDCEEDAMSYVAGYLFQTRINNGVPLIPDTKIDEETMERIIRCLGKDAFFTKDGSENWSLHLPKGGGRHNGITAVTEELGYSKVAVMKRKLPDEKYINASFLRGLADFCGHVHGGDIIFTPNEAVMPEIEKVLDTVGLQYSHQKGEIVIHNYPSTLVHQAEKVRLLRQWEEGISGEYTFRNDYVPIVDIRKTDRVEDMICLKVEDDSHTFVLANGMVTHNTTLLGVLSAYIPNDERIVTIEDAAELQLHQDHVVRLEARPANAEGKGRVTIRDLVINALRMRPDRIIVGECRGGEALDMLTAMNTGHDGSLTTGHANSPRDMLSRLETMVMMSGMELPEKAIRQQISSAINIIVQQARLRDGSRKITSISEITGMEGTEITMQDIYRFHQTGLDEKGRITGVFEATGVRPNCLERLQAAGALVKDDWFVKGELS